MKKLFLPIFIVLTVGGILLAQPPIVEWDKIKSIKLLETTRDEVTKLLASESLDSWTHSHVQNFYTNNSVIRVQYSNGTCSAEFEEWNVPDWVVTEITVSPKDHIALTKAGINYSKFRKERTDWQRKKIYVLFDKPSGIAISVFGSRIDSIHLFPSARSYPLLCKNEEVKEYYASKHWMRDPSSKKAIIDYNVPSDVLDVVVSNTVEDPRRFSVMTTAENSDYDILTYVYKITGGKIIGSGVHVVWDLSGVQPGTYSITAAADDGCGLCGKFITKSVVIK